MWPASKDYDQEILRHQREEISVDDRKSANSNRNVSSTGSISLGSPKQDLAGRTYEESGLREQAMKTLNLAEPLTTDDEGGPHFPEA